VRSCVRVLLTGMTGSGATIVTTLGHRRQKSFLDMTDHVELSILDTCEILLVVPNKALSLALSLSLHRLSITCTAKRFNISYILQVHGHEIGLSSSLLLLLLAASAHAMPLRRVVLKQKKNTAFNLNFTRIRPGFRSSFPSV
jgi:hypothetical protein